MDDRNSGHRDSSSGDLDYRDLIKAEFLKRRETKPFYSLRNFADDLGLQPSHLSGLFAKKCGLSINSARAITKELGLRPFAARRFYFLVSVQSGRSIVERNAAKQGLKKKWIAEADAELRQRVERLCRTLGQTSR